MESQLFMGILKSETAQRILVLFASSSNQGSDADSPEASLFAYSKYEYLSMDEDDNSEIF